MGDLFPGCAMTERTRQRPLVIHRIVTVRTETLRGDEERSIDSEDLVSLAETEGLVLRRGRNTECAGVHFVMRQGNGRLVHFAIQCKGGGMRGSFNALRMYNDAMKSMSAVEGMDVIAPMRQ